MREKKLEMPLTDELQKEKDKLTFEQLQTVVGGQGSYNPSLVENFLATKSKAGS